jgi:hypothetical protein
LDLIAGAVPMTHREKVDLFVADLARRGVSEYISAPPAWRLAWRLGLKVPPPHFIGLFPMALTSGLVFGALWGVAMHFLVWGRMGWVFSAFFAAVAGILFGVCFASYYRLSAKKLNLPSWEQYSEA